ncbi:MAG: GNAT family N-acetyltransferase [Candidatus Pacearchaeota archaeon]|nr:MAG: GNAT family N-acetyltransferase [Candidatus Pacearchaeota archaeon]
MKKEAELKIRKAKKEDIAQIEEIYREGVVDEVKTQFPKKTKKNILKDFDKWKKEHKKSYKKDIKSLSERFIVALIEKEIVGFANAKIQSYDKTQGEINRIYLKRNWRGKKISKALLKDLLMWLKSRKVDSVAAGMFIKNKKSRDLHKSFGFKNTAIRMQKKFKK